MSDTSLRLAERALLETPSREAARALVASARRLGAEQALVVLDGVEERLMEAGRGLALAAQNEAICGATQRPAMAAMCANAAAILAIGDARIALDNDIALRPARSA